MNPKPTRDKALSLLNKGQAKDAEALLSRLCRGAHDNPQDRMLLATAQLRQRRYDAAIPSIRRALELGGYNAQAFSMLAALLLRQGDRVQAETCFTRLQNGAVSAAESHRLVAGALCQLGDYASAAEQYRQAVARDPDHFQAHAELAAVLRAANQFPAALEQYRQLARMRADHAPAYTGMGICLANMKRIDEAADILQKSLEIDSANAETHFQLGETYQLLCRYSDAAACYRRALQLSPRTAAIYGSLARALRNQGDTQGALNCLRELLKLEPDSAPAHHETAICLYDERDRGPAREAFEKAVAANPSMAQSRFFLGMVHAQDGDEAAARIQFEEACRLWPYLECFVDSFRYARVSGPAAHYFSGRKQLFEFAVAAADSEGLFLEFGVYHGASINIIARLTPREVHGFDTFQGLPQDWVVSDGQKESTERAGFYSTRGAIPEAPDNVSFHVGTFEDTLPGFCSTHKERVSFMNVDCDLYESTRTIFENLGRQITVGTIIVFDDYFCFPGWREHEAKAFREYVDGSGLTYEYLAFNFFTGQVVVRMIARD